MNIHRYTDGESMIRKSIIKLYAINKYPISKNKMMMHPYWGVLIAFHNMLETYSKKTTIGWVKIH